MEAAVAVHREAHGEVANEIIEVESRDVSAFLGRLDDPPAAPAARESGLNPFRTIVFTDMARSTNLTQQLGDTGAMELIHTHNEIVRDALRRYDGNEIKHTGDGIMACFASVTGALQATIAIQQALLEHNAATEGPHVEVRVGLSAGEPVQDGGDLFGAAVQLARRICDHAEPGTIFASNVVRELAIGKPFRFADRGEAQLKGFDDPVRVHEVHWSPD
jgi:class 3 adenylate cyclase